MPPPSPYVDLERPPLREGALRRAVVVPGGFVRDLRVVAETGSTNAEVRKLATQDAPEGTVLVAEYQNAGRGRLDRGWTSPPRSGLTFSVLLRPSDVPAGRWTWLPLLTGCAVAHAVTAVTDLAAELKWPNDVLIDDRKVCGILLERVETPSGAAAVVGVGLNVSTRAAEMPSDEATSLLAAGATVTDRDTLLRAILRTLGALYAAWRAAGGDPEDGLRQAYRTRCSTLGRQVRVELDAEHQVEGTARDIDPDGRLVVTTPSGERAFGAGDVVHVR